MIENWHSHFVPECFFDTLLFKKILNTNKRLKHTKGCNNVINRFRIVNGKKGDLFDSPFGLGMVDKDKKELDFLKTGCDLEIDLEKLLIWKVRGKKQFIIQLNPPLENWIIDVMNDCKLIMEDFEYSAEYKKLKKQIKSDIDDEKDVRLNKLVNAFIKLEHPVVQNLKTILLYFRDKTNNADIEELKKIILN